MTWEEIKPVAESILGEGCGEMTLDELWDFANECGLLSVSALIKYIESLGYERKVVRAIESAAAHQGYSYPQRNSRNPTR